MNPERWRQVDALFRAAKERPPGERAAFLARTCGGDDALRAEVESLLAHDGRAGRLGFPAAPPTLATDAGDPRAAWTGPAESAVRYAPLRLHAQGGLGEVFEARDEQLGRPVALKRLQDRHDADPESRRRFLAEAEVTARLEHPGVVPVHGLAHAADGRPCYAMRFVRGETLHEAIRRFHEADRPGLDVGERRLALRQLLGRFVAVCNTIAYAHSRGVLHRDLKPANILLGSYGETLVVDWGLAKQVTDGSDPTPPTRSAREAGPGKAPASPPDTICPAGGAESGTQPGEVLGTPAFMSPEQAAGRWDAVGSTSDVYSLGATLYTILTGRPPFEGLADLDQVRAGAFPPPRRVKAGVPRALEAVCLKATALRPEERYATALELAAEVERWLADEPVRAYREPLRDRLGRWARRHKPAVAGALSLLLAGLTSLAVIAGLLDRARRQSEQEQARTRAEGERAEKNLEDSRRAVREHFLVLSEIKLGPDTGLHRERRALLEAALRYFEDFLRQHPDDPRFRADLAEAHLRAGLITSELGPKEQARDAFTQARDLYARLAQDHPAAAAYQTLLARSHARLGAACRETGRHAEAEQASQQARALFRELADRQPTVADHQAELAACCNGLGDGRRATGRLPEAEQAYRDALTLLQALCDAHPGALAHQANRAATQVSLGKVLLASGRPKEAEQQLQEAVASCQRLAARYLGSAESQDELADCRHELATFHYAVGKHRQAEQGYQSAQAVWQRLAERHPTVPHYQARLAHSHHNLGLVYKATGRLEEAERACQSAQALKKALADQHPTVPGYQAEWAGSHVNLGTLYQGSGRLDKAEQAYADALALYRKLADAHPDVPKLRADLAQALNNLGNLCRETGRPRQAEQLLCEALEVRRALAEKDPALPEYQAALAQAYNNLGFFYQKAGRLDEAEPALRNALELRQRLARTYPSLVEFPADVAQTQVNLGEVARGRRGAGAGLEWYTRAVATLTPAVANHPHLARARVGLRDAHWRRADALTGLGRHAEALPDWERALELESGRAREWFRRQQLLALARAKEHVRAAAEADLLAGSAKATAADLYDAARIHAAAAAAVGGEGPLTGRYAARALELLRLAVEKGFNDLDPLRKEADLDALRPLEGFKQLLADVERRRDQEGK